MVGRLGLSPLEAVLQLDEVLHGCTIALQNALVNITALELLEQKAFFTWTYKKLEGLQSRLLSGVTLSALSSFMKLFKKIINPQ